MFNKSVKNCEGCQIDDSSQKSHMGDSCCYREWQDVVKEYWGQIKSTTTLPEGMKLAEKVTREVRTILATSSASPVVDYTEEEKKEFVVANKGMSRDKLLGICQKFHQQCDWICKINHPRNISFLFTYKFFWLHRNSIQVTV